MSGKVRELAEDRFDRYVIPEPNSGCWIWTGTLSTAGYGRFWVDGRAIQAHRYMKERQLGRPIPQFIEACHSCDFPPCVNPAHVFEGTRRDNAVDAYKKHRCVPPIYTSAENPNAKLKERDIPVIKYLVHEKGLSRNFVGGVFGVSRAVVGKICAGVSWKGVE